ncbi:medium-chain acyl-CoA ligase ACSF2, mitochondrial-like isoform X2 [Micropterus dolomieu]|uniref:medium-chain acyl-CoA ligase ACSF2, mitochondrial-like isoform X2 n=1 Tax=Micropterus dolomieu TaxID=147949 RepID=UPI001E8D54DC|nr:medium-chain acyl-CoA ligase ACSF2, mitochondrial-like isoform X2 [Micropterus dolomieu]
MGQGPSKELQTIKRGNFLFPISVVLSCSAERGAVSCSCTMIPTIALCSQSLRNTCVFPRALNVLQRPWTGQPGLLAASRIHVDSPPVIPTLTTSYAHGTSSTSLLHSTIAETLQNTVERWPDREAVVFVEDGVRKTFAQFNQDVDQAAAGLLALGLQKGDRLGMWGPNTYEWILFQFATAKAGVILVSVNPAYQLQEVEFALRKVGCKAIVCPTQFKTQKYCDMLRQICPEIESSAPGDIKSARLPDLRSVIVLDSRQPGMLHFDDVMQAGSSQYMRQLQDLQKKLSFDDPINIQFTSGTTGAPKGATLSHHNMINNAYFVGKRVGYTWRPHTRVCLPVPLYHCFGSVAGGLCMAVHGVSLVFPSAGYNGKANIAALESERCTLIYGTPTMYVDMINQPDLAKYDLSSVEAGLMAGSPCPPELVKNIISVMGVKGITIVYGTTENSPVTFCASPTDNLERKSETIGFIMDHLEAKIVNPTTGEVLPLGMMGEIMIRGYCVMLEYWGDPAKTQECITKEGWYKTGDIGSIDAYGYCRIEGRIKDMIIRGGENVYPAEIEQFLHTHPKVMEAQVVGVEDVRMGEEVCACIKLVDGQDCTAEEIKAYCKGQIAHFKIPRYVLFVTSYPLTVTGKIQKHKLRDVAEKQLGLKKGK